METSVKSVEYKDSIEYKTTIENMNLEELQQLKNIVCNTIKKKESETINSQTTNKDLYEVFGQSRIV
tara:strand:+ start:3183 stop:3383 length:201 start_codon:yes stop_codon:yes gene_type:complete